MKIKEGFVIEEVGGSYLAVAVGDRADSFNGLVRMNGTGAFLWRELEKGEVTRDMLVEKLLSVYEVDRETAARDVDGFVSKLASEGIIE